MWEAGGLWLQVEFHHPHCVALSQVLHLTESHPHIPSFLLFLKRLWFIWRHEACGILVP